MPPTDNSIPSSVSATAVSILGLRLLTRFRIEKGDIPRLMTLPSTHHSPTTVNKNATVLTIGTVRLSSVPFIPPTVSNPRPSKATQRKPNEPNQTPTQQHNPTKTPTILIKIK